jgi:hypothetical protein
MTLISYRPSTARHKMLFEERLGGEERRLMHLVPAQEIPYKVEDRKPRNLHVQPLQL